MSEQKGWWISVALCFIFIILSSFTFVHIWSLYRCCPAPSQLLVISHVAVMLLFLLLLLFTTECLTLIFALPWLSVLCWLFFFPPPLCPSIVSVWLVTIFTYFLFVLISMWPALPHLPPFPPPLSSLSLLTLVMSALACFGVTNHPLRNLRAKIKTPAHANPPAPPPLCTAIGCCLLATTHPVLCLILCVCAPSPPGLSCPALIGGCFLVPSLWLAVLMANGVVHQNMGFLLTGTTSVRSVSTKSKARTSPWGTTPPSLRREYHLTSSNTQPAPMCPFVWNSSDF